MKRRFLFPVICAIAVSACADRPIVQQVQHPRVELSQVTLNTETARQEINRYRASKGLGPVVLNKRLTVAAQRHSDDLAKNDTISHRGSDGSNPWDRVKQTGYVARLAAENVGVGQRSFAEVLQGWKESPGHNKNLLLRDATQIGIALVVSPETRNQTFWTLVLGTPSKARMASR